MNVLNVLGRLTGLEPLQADLLHRICDGPLVSADELRASGAFSATVASRRDADERQGNLDVRSDD